MRDTKPLVEKLGFHVGTGYKIECWRKGKLMWQDNFYNRVVTAGLNKLLDATFKTGLTTPAWFVGLVGSNITDAAITSGAAALTSVSNPFTTADVGAAITVVGAGAAGADLITTISAFVGAGNVTLADNAGTTVSGAEAGWGGRPADTMASKSFTEVVPYSDATRPAFTPGTIAAGAVDNSASKASFTVNAPDRIFGAFLADNSTKSGTTGTLYGMGPFSLGSRQIQSGDTLNVQVDLSATAA